jgi:hypothetical protein
MLQNILIGTLHLIFKKLTVGKLQVLHNYIEFLTHKIN